MSSKFIVYKMTNIVSGFYYIGKTSNYYRRRTNHKCALNKNRHFNAKIQADFDATGRDWSNYRFTEIKTNIETALEAAVIEHKILAEAIKDPLCCNLVTGAQGCVPHKKHAPHSEAHKQALSESIRGVKKSEEHKQALKDAWARRKAKVALKEDKKDINFLSEKKS